VTTGAELRDAGMKRAVDAEGDAWKALAINEIRRQARAGWRITAETVTAAVGLPAHPNVMGALFSKLKRAGEITDVGYLQATRTERHGSRMLVWEGVRPGVPMEAANPPSLPPSERPIFGDPEQLRAMRQGGRR
jgi:hypothetical protein